MPVNLNGLSLAEKIKIQQQIQQQNGTPIKFGAGSVNKADMNTSIWGNQNLNTVQGRKPAGEVQKQQAVPVGQNNPKPVGSPVASGHSGKTAAVYENPKNIHTLQDLTKAKTALHVQMATQGSNYRLEQLDMQLDARREELSNNPAQSSGKPDGAAAMRQASGALSKGNSTKAKGNSQLNQANNSTNQANKISQDSKDKQAKLNKTSAALNKSVKTETKGMQSTFSQIQNLNSQIEQRRQEIDDMMTQLQELTGGDNTGVGKSSAYSLELAGEDMPPTDNTKDGKKIGFDDNRRHGVKHGSGSSDDKASQVTDLQQRIQQAGGQMNTSSSQVKKLVTANSKRAKTMSRNVQNQQKYFATTKKALTQNKTTGDKIVNFGQKTVQVGNTVHTIGQTTETIGKGVQWVGRAMAAIPYTAAAAPAVIEAGTTVNQVGNKVAMVGSGVTTAGNVTESAGNLANGDTNAALASAGSAIKSGASAYAGAKAGDKIAEQGEGILEKAMDTSESNYLESLNDMVGKFMSENPASAL